MKIFSTEKKLLAGFIFTLIGIGFFLGITFLNVQKNIVDIEEAGNSIKALNLAKDISKNILHFESSNRGYAITGNENFLGPYYNSLKQNNQHYSELLNTSAATNPEFPYMVKLIDLANRKIKFGQNVVETRKKYGTQEALNLINKKDGQELMDSINLLVAKIEKLEKEVLQRENKEVIQRSKATLNLFIMLSIIVFIFLTISFIIIREDLLQRKKLQIQLRDFNINLETEIKYKTFELASIFERVTEAFIALDKNYCFTYANKKFCEIINQDSSALIGNQIWTVLPHGKNDTVYQAYLKAMHEQKYICVEEYFEAYSCWFENHIYPSAEGLSVFYRDTTSKKLAEEKVKESHQQLRLLSSHLQTIREEERTSIAREIHDEFGQQLTGLKMDASWLLKKIPPDPLLQKKIIEMINLIDDTVKSVKRISTYLRPGILDDFGLIPALDWQSHEFRKKTGINCEFNAVLNELPLDKNIETGIFRVFQETLTNVARHSHATAVQTTFEHVNENVYLTVKDNGIGFDISQIRNKRTLGLLGMQERALMFKGQITIKSEIGNGTSIQLRIPIET